MITVEKSVIINKPVKDVFFFVSNEGTYLKFQPDVHEVIENGPRNTVGSSFTEVRMFMGKEMRTTLEVTAYEPYKKWAGKVIDGPVFYETTITYEAVDGGTKYTTRVVGEPKGFFKLAEGRVSKYLEKSLAADLQRLKMLVEEG